MATCLNLYSQTLGIPTGTSALEKECIGVTSDNKEMPLSDWIAVWSGTLPDDPLNRTCSQLYHDEIYSLGGNSIFNPPEFTRISEQYTYMLSKYFNTTITGHNISLPGRIDYNAFQDTLIKSCRDVGGVCTNSELKLCNGCTRTDISNNSSLVGLCGCYSPDLSAAVYGRDIPKACDPLCNNSAASKITDSATGAASVCTDTVCVIDNLSINTTKSLVGGISITQLCAGCGSGCTCIIDTSVLNLAAGIGLDNPALFQQYCPPAQSTCLVIDNTAQTSTVIPCASRIASPAASANAAIPLMAYVILIIIVVLVLIVLAAYIYVASSKKAYVPRVNPLTTLRPIARPPLIEPIVYYPALS